MSNQSITPKVSILVPTYNRSRFLRQTLNSILAQTFEDFEVIVVDNCSTDDTTEVVASFADLRIIYHRNLHNVGPVLNHNIAFRQAKGEYVYIFSDDDLMLECNNLALKVAILDKHSDVVLVHSSINIINADDEVIGANWASEHEDWPRVLRESLMSGDEAYDILYHGHNFINLPTVMLRKCILDKYRLEFNNQLGYLVDWNLWLQLALVGNFYYIDEVLVSYRLHGQNESLKLSKELMFRELVLAKLGLTTIYGNIFSQTNRNLNYIINSTYIQLKINDSFVQKCKNYIKYNLLNRR